MWLPWASTEDLSWCLFRISRDVACLGRLQRICHDVYSVFVEMWSALGVHRGFVMMFILYLYRCGLPWASTEDLSWCLSRICRDVVCLGRPQRICHDVYPVFVEMWSALGVHRGFVMMFIRICRDVVCLGRPQRICHDVYPRICRDVVCLGRPQRICRDVYPVFVEMWSALGVHRGFVMMFIPYL